MIRDKRLEWTLKSVLICFYWLLPFITLVHSAGGGRGIAVTAKGGKGKNVVRPYDPDESNGSWSVALVVILPVAQMFLMVGICFVFYSIYVHCCAKCCRWRRRRNIIKKAKQIVESNNQINKVKVKQKALSNKLSSNCHNGNCPSAPTNAIELTSLFHTNGMHHENSYPSLVIPKPPCPVHPNVPNGCLLHHPRAMPINTNHINNSNNNINRTNRVYPSANGYISNSVIVQPSYQTSNQQRSIQSNTLRPIQCNSVTTTSTTTTTNPKPNNHNQHMVECVVHHVSTLSSSQHIFEPISAAASPNAFSELLAQYPPNMHNQQSIRPLQRSNALLSDEFGDINEQVVMDIDKDEQLEEEDFAIEHEVEQLFNPDRPICLIHNPPRSISANSMHQIALPSPARKFINSH